LTVPHQDIGEQVPIAAAERIVAFTQPGKPPENAFLRQIWRRRGSGTFAMRNCFQTVPGKVGRRTGAVEMAAAGKKRESRKSLHQSGWITLEGGFAARPCVVQDLSATGAKITIDDPNALPSKLRLAFARDARTGRNCEVVWRRGRSIGVKFVR
jgi:hypothetical protein